MKPLNLKPQKWNPPWAFDWSNQKLWALNISSSEINIRTLTWVLGMPIWSTIKGKDLRNLIPNDVISNPETYEEHYKRIKDTDLRFPIDCSWIKGKYYILDGVHRLAKHVLENHSIIQIRKIKNEHFDQIRK